MAVVKPFKAWRYDRDKSPHLEDVIVPPYDVISEKERDALQKSNRHNFSKIILAQGENKHYSAALILNEWKNQEILIQDENPGFYFYRQEFRLGKFEMFCQKIQAPPSGVMVRYGVFARVQVEDYKNNVIFPHEKTFAKHKADRYELMEASQGNMEPVFLGYDSPFLSGDDFEKMIRSGKLLYDYEDHYGVKHKLWYLSDEETCGKVSEHLKSEKLYILDGHHRYETALKFYQDHPSEETKYVLADVCAFKQPGMVILPTHRLVSGIKDFSPENVIAKLAEDFNFAEVKDLSALEARLKASTHVAFGMTFSVNEKMYFVELKSAQKVLDLDFLHGTLFTPSVLGEELQINYVKNIPEFLDNMKSGKHQIGFLVRPNTYEDIVEKAAQHQVMPHKSTFFYPKIPSGLVINKFDL